MTRDPVTTLTTSPQQYDLQILQVFFIGVCLYVVVLFVSTPHAEASCGDWLDQSAMQHQESHKQPKVAPHASSPPTSPRPASPCKGPLCRNAPTVPVPFAPTSSRTSKVDTGWMLVASELPDHPRRSDSYHELSLSAPAGHPLRIRRPPRY